MNSLICVFTFLFLFQIGISQGKTEYELNKVYSNDTRLNTNIKKKFEQPFFMEELNTFFKNKIQMDLDSARWFSSIKIRDIIPFKDNKIDLVLNYQKSNKITLDTIVFKNVIQTNNSTLLRQSRLTLGQKITPTDVNQSNKWLSSSAYINEVNEISWFKTPTGKYGLLVDVEEQNIVFINGVFGYNPDGKSSTLSADLELKFKNISGTGREAEIKWKKIDNKDEQFSLNYGEPWVFNTPLVLNLSIEKLFRDSSYITWNYNTKFSYPLSPELSIGFNYDYSTTTPIDSAVADLLSLPVNTSSFSSFEIAYTTLNRLINPTSGISINLTLSSGRTKNIRPAWLLERLDYTSSSKKKLNAEFIYVTPVSENSVFYTKSIYKMIEGDHLLISDQFYIGGTNTLRGFREFQFESTRYFINTLEYRFLTDKHSRIYGFTDTAFINKKTEFSYGIGIRFKNPLGIFGVSFALPKGASFSEGILHFGLYSDID